MKLLPKILKDINRLENSSKQEVIQYVQRFTNFLILFGTKELPQQWKESIIVPIYKKGDKTGCSIIERYHCCQLYKNFIQYSSLKVNTIRRKNDWRNIIMDLDETVNYRSDIFHSSGTGGKSGSIMGQYMSYL
jgi:hypothetical protein